MKRPPFLVPLVLLASAIGCKKPTNASKPWETMALKQVSDESSATKFTITLPDGLERKDDPSLGLSFSTAYEGMNGLEVRVSVSEYAEQMEKEAKSLTTLSSVDVVTKKALNSGPTPDFLVSGKAASGKKAVAHTFKRSAQTAIHCTATLANDAPLPELDKKLKFLEAVCTSVTPAVAATPFPEGAAGAAGSAAPSVPAPNQAPPADVGSFLAQVGPHKSTAAALKKFGGAKLKADDMDIYDLLQPQITRTHNEDGGKTCYEISGKAGATTRAFDVCWLAGKIVSVKNLGMRP